MSILDISNIAELPDHILWNYDLNKDQMESIPLSKRIKIIKDYSEPVKFGRFYWHILSLTQNKVLLLSTDVIIEDVKCDKISLRLRSFFDENFTEIEKESVIGRELFCLDKTDVINYLDQSESAIGRHWWIQNNNHFSKKKDDLQQYECVNSTGKIDVFYWNIPLAIRPALKVKIVYNEQDIRWNEVWKNASIHEFNLRGNWKSIQSKKVEEVDLHPDYRMPQANTQVTETVEFVPIIDVTGM